MEKISREPERNYLLAIEVVEPIVNVSVYGGYTVTTARGMGV